MTHITEAIEDDIERIRERMGTSIERLGSELNPGRMIKSAFGTEGTSGNETLDMVATKARENPIPTALVGIGLLGIFLSRGHKGSGAKPAQRSSTRGQTGEPSERVGKHLADLQEGADQAIESASNKVATANAHVKSEVKAAKNSLENASTRLATSISENATAAKDAISTGAEDASIRAAAARKLAAEKLRQVPADTTVKAKGAVDWVKENPVPAGLMALAAGAALSSFFTTRSSGKQPATDEPRATHNDEIATSPARIGDLADEGLTQITPKRETQPRQRKKVAKASTPSKTTKRSAPKKSTGTPKAGTSKAMNGTDQTATAAAKKNEHARKQAEKTIHNG